MRKVLSFCVDIVIHCLVFVLFQVYERCYSSSNLNNVLGKTVSGTGYHP